MKNYYDILGLKCNATSDEIRTAYRKLSHKFHPDKNDGEEFFADMFKQILEAYGVLINADKRAVYDLKLQRENSQPRANAFRYEQPVAHSQDRPVKRTGTVTVWTSVENWKKRRNIAALINVGLVLIIFMLPRASSSNPSERNNDLEQSPAKEVVEPYIQESEVEEEANEVSVVDTFINNGPQENNTPFAEPKSEPSPENNGSTYLPSAIDSVEPPKEESTPKRRGLLKRIFGKRNKDTIQ